MSGNLLSQWYALIFVINEKALTAAWPEICKKMEDSLLLVDKKYGQQAVKRIEPNSKQDPENDRRN